MAAIRLFLPCLSYFLSQPSRAVFCLHPGPGRPWGHDMLVTFDSAYTLVMDSLDIVCVVIEPHPKYKLP